MENSYGSNNLVFFAVCYSSLTSLSISELFHLLLNFVRVSVSPSRGWQPPMVAHALRRPALNYVNTNGTRYRSPNSSHVRKSRATTAFANSLISHLPSIRDDLHVFQSPQRRQRRPSDLSIASPRVGRSSLTAADTHPVAPLRKHASPMAERQGTVYQRLVILTRQRYPSQSVRA